MMAWWRGGVARNGVMREYIAHPTPTSNTHPHPNIRLPMTEEDLKTGRKLLEEDFVKANPEWVKELEIMLETKTKVLTTYMLYTCIYINIHATTYSL